MEALQATLVKPCLKAELVNWDLGYQTKFGNFGLELLFKFFQQFFPKDTSS